MTHPQPPAARAGSRYRGRLTAVFVLVVIFFGVEVAGGLLTGSLALLSDAGHMATDALGLGMALMAIVAADRARHGSGRTYGLYRLEILSALFNALLLFGVAGYVLVEAVRRFAHPRTVLSGPMLVVAGAGLVVNLVSWRLLRAGSSASINVEGAFLEVVADLAGSVAVVVAAIVLRLTGWVYADPIFGAAIGLFILPRAWHLAGRALRVLVEAAPPGIDLERIRCTLGQLPGVVDVHDLHVWTLTSEMDVASAHLMIGTDQDPHATLDEARVVLRDRFGVDHATLQVEPDTHQGCTEMSW